MRVTYDRQSDTLTITLREDRIRESDEVRPGVIADFGYDAAAARKAACLFRGGFDLAHDGDGGFGEVLQPRCASSARAGVLGSGCCGDAPTACLAAKVCVPDTLPAGTHVVEVRSLGTAQDSDPVVVTVRPGN